jgi:hypothetical protein
MDNLTQITDHVEAGGKRLLAQFWDTQAQTFDQVMFQRYQDLEDIIFEMMGAKYLSAATGFTLEEIGDLVGYPLPAGWDSTADANDYRALVYGQIAANVSYGTKSDIYDILGALETTDRRVYNLFPRSIHVDFIASEIISDCACIVDIIESATHRIEINVTAHTEGYFGFDDDPGALGFDEGEIGEGA